MKSIAAAPSNQEQDALDALTRTVALALQDQGLRQQIKDDMRAAPQREHKLAFTSYVHGTSGGILLAKMVQASGKSREEILSLIDSVRPLEFYMPVAEHRTKWTGGPDLLVVSQLEDEDTPHAYNLQGKPESVSLAAPPSTPTFSLVPVETDFTHSLDAKEWVNTEDRSGEAIGNYRRRGSQGGGGGLFQAGINSIDPGDGYCEATPETPCEGGRYAPRPAGLYMTYLYLDDLHEPWTKGKPEIEVHVQGPNNGDKTKGKDLSCAGEDQPLPRRFDMNDHSWSGEVLLFSQQQMIDFNNQFADLDSAGYQVIVWEDDDTSCVVKTDNTSLRRLLTTALAVRGGISVIVKNPTNFNLWRQHYGTFVAAVYEIASWLKSNDDYAGVFAAPIPAGGTLSRTATVDNDGGNAGTMTLKLVD